jgi:hypothetical protein
LQYSFAVTEAQKNSTDADRFADDKVWSTAFRRNHSRQDLPPQGGIPNKKIAPMQINLQMSL